MTVAKKLFDVHLPDGTLVEMFDGALTDEDIVKIYKAGPKEKREVQNPMTPHPAIPTVITKSDLEKFDDYASTLRTPTNNESYESKLIKALVKDNIRLRRIVGAE